MMRLGWIYFVFLISIKISYSSDYQLVDSAKFNNPLVGISCDNQGFVYVHDNTGIVYKYNQKLEHIQQFSPVKNGPITTLDARQGLRIFIFYEPFQEITLLDRFLSLTQSFGLPTQQIGYASQVAYGQDNNLWILDDIEPSLKKFDVPLQRVTFELNLQTIPFHYPFRQAITYQNRLYLVHQTGIIVFDQFGGFLKEINYEHDSKIAFWDNYFYYINEYSVTFQPLYTNIQVKQALQLPTKVNGCVLFEDFLWAFRQKKLYLYKKK